MKLKNIIPALALLLSPFALVSCGDKGNSADGGSEAAKAAPESHAEVSKEVVAVMTDMMTKMSEVKDVASAEAFAAGMPEVKQKMKDLLAAAKALPAPTAEEKKAYQAASEAAEEKMMPVMMKMGEAMQNNPNVEAIGKVMEKAMNDEEMDAVAEELEALYEE